MFLPTLVLNIANPRQNGSVWEHSPKNLAVHDPKKLTDFYFMNSKTLLNCRKSVRSPRFPLQKNPIPTPVGNFPPPHLQTHGWTCSKTSSAMALGGRITKFSSATLRFTLEKHTSTPLGLIGPPPSFQKKVFCRQRKSSKRRFGVDGF